MGNGFPATSGKIAPTSGSSDWPNRGPHMMYKWPLYSDGHFAGLGGLKGGA